MVYAKELIKLYKKKRELEKKQNDFYRKKRKLSKSYKKALAGIHIKIMEYKNLLKNHKASFSKASEGVYYMKVNNKTHYINSYE